MRPRIGLALSGGGAKGAFTVGALQVLGPALKVDHYDVVAGTSTGALIGTMLASNQFARLVQIYRGTKTENIVNPNHALVATVLGTEAVLFSSAILGGRAIFDTAALRRTTEANVNFQKVKDSKTRLLLSIVDLQTGDVETLEAQKLSKRGLVDAVMASASMPVLMEPVDVKVGDRTHQRVDGGVREFLPLTAVFQSGVPLDHIIAISTAPIAPRRVPRPFEGIIEILARTVDLYDTENARNDFHGAVQFNGLLTLIDLARQAGVSDAKLKRELPAGLWQRTQGKRAIPITFIGPEKHLDFDSLTFEPEVMRAAMKLGQKAGRAALRTIQPHLPAPVA